MYIVAASMHHAFIFRLEGDIRFFLYGKCIEISAQPDYPTLSLTADFNEDAVSITHIIYNFDVLIVIEVFNELRCVMFFK